MKIKDLYKSKKNWTQEWFARKADGSEASWSDPDAVSFCLSGAMQRCYKKSEIMGIQRRILRVINPRNKPLFTITWWNDNTNYRTVKNLVLKLDI